jgi:hypothetical protein
MRRQAAGFADVVREKIDSGESFGIGAVLE